MTFSLALPKSPESLSIVAGLEGENARKAAGSEAVDGFAELLDQLALVASAASGKSDAGEGALPERQEIELPTGKSLPLSAFLLPIVLPETAAGDDAGAPEFDPAGLVPVTAPAVAATIPAAAIPAAGLARAPETAEVKPVVAQTPVAALTLRPTLEPVPAPVSQTPGFEVRIAAAQEPRDARLVGMTPTVENGRVRMELPGTAPAAPQPVAVTDAAPVTASPQAGQPLRPIAAVQTEALAQAEVAKDARPAAGETRKVAASKPDGAALPSAPAVERQPANEREAARSDTSADDQAAPARSALQGEAPKAQVLPGRVEPATVATPTHAAAPRPVVTDSVAQVERVVEHLMAARQFDLTKPAAIAVAHKEFGALTVTFDSTANGMNVEIAADDSEAHRALAAAMASDRSAARPQEPAMPATSTSHQSNQTSAERGGASSQSGTGFGQGSPDGQRSQHADQRGRHGERAASQPQAGPSSNSDNALYA